MNWSRLFLGMMVIAGTIWTGITVAPKAKSPPVIALHLVKVHGYSMEPYVHNGQALIIGKWPYEDLKSGMVAERGAKRGETLLHVLLKNRYGVWKTSPANQWVGATLYFGKTEPGYMTERTYQGVWMDGSKPMIVPIP